VVKLDGAPVWPLMDTLEPSPHLRETLHLALDNGFTLEISVDLKVNGSIEYTNAFGSWNLSKDAQISGGSAISCRLMHAGRLVSSTNASIKVIQDGSLGTELICDGSLLFLNPDDNAKAEKKSLEELAQQQERVISRLTQPANQDRSPFREWKEKWNPEAPALNDETTTHKVARVKGTPVSIYSGSSIRVLYSPCRFLIPLLHSQR
jgi:hypothetical protein